MDNFNLKKYLAEGKLLNEELTYTFSEYDYDINDDAYQAEVEAGIKAKYPEISDEDLKDIIDSSVEYYYDEARDENKMGRDADPTPSSDIVSMAVDYYEDEYLAEGRLNENQDDSYYIDEIKRDLEELDDKEANEYLEELAKSILKLKR